MILVIDCDKKIKYPKGKNETHEGRNEFTKWNDWIFKYIAAQTILLRLTFVLHLTTGKPNNNETLKLTMGCDQVKNYAANIEILNLLNPESDF